MDFLSATFTPEFFAALGAIVLLDLVLAGDNAIVIGLAARNVPQHMRGKVILWGTVGAIVVRTLLTLVVVWLLKIPGFLLVGGLALIWIAWGLTQDAAEAGHQIEAKTSVRAAIQTIIVADTVMGVDNVLAIGGVAGGAANGNMLLVVLGLLISIPIVMWGSQLVLKLVDRFPSIAIIGAGVLGWTAAKMISMEPLIRDWLAARHGWTAALVAFAVGLVTLPAVWRRFRRR